MNAETERKMPEKIVMMAIMLLVMAARPFVFWNRFAAIALSNPVKIVTEVPALKDSTAMLPVSARLSSLFAETE